MKVNMPDNAKEWMTLKQAKIAKQIIRDMRGDESTVQDYARIAAGTVVNNNGRNGYVKEILKASAEVCFDRATAWDRFGQDCEHANVWIDAIAETDFGFLRVGCLLSDVWDLDGTQAAADNLIAHAYIRRYEEVRSN